MLDVSGLFSGKLSFSGVLRLSNICIYTLCKVLFREEKNLTDGMEINGGYVVSESGSFKLKYMQDFFDVAS